MTDKGTIYRAFNKHFFEFLDDISRIFPENNEIKNAKMSFELIKMGSPTAIIKAWFANSSVIDAGDITFFFEKDYYDDIGHLDNSNEIMHIIDKIRGPIKNMTDKERGYTAKYIQNLSKMSVIYSGM
jgi:hypothetical protein